MDTYIISKPNIDAFKALNLQNVNLIQDKLENLNTALLKGDMVYIDESLDSNLKKLVLEKLNLFAQKIVFEKNGKFISVFSQNVFDSISSFDTTTNGSVAKDTLSHSTLLVEKVAREAYEDAKQNLLNVDNANAFASSNIWRKVVTNINEDYPQIDLMNLSVEDFNIYFSQRYENIEVILVDPYIKNIVTSGIIQNGFKLQSSIFVNDIGIKANLYKVK